MPLRKRVNKDAAGTQPTAGEREDVSDDDSEVEFLSLSPATTSRPKRKREAKSKAAPKELTEEEMFDLAVRLSEQEASDAAQRRQQEEDEALQRAIEESMSQTQPLPPSRTPSPPLDTVPRRRRLEFCSDGPGPSVRLEVTSQRSCRAEIHPELDRRGLGDTNNNNRMKRKRNAEDSSPLPEMPDLSQTQKIFTQTSPFPSSSQCSEPPSTQDFTQHDEPSSPLPPPPTPLRPSLVCLPRMSQELLATCQSGSVSCSQENFVSSLPSRPKTPTFTKGLSLVTADPALSQSPTFPKSPVFSGGQQREQDSRSPASPIFGRTSQNLLRPPLTPMLPESPALSKNVAPAKTSPSPTFLGSQGISKNPCLSESRLFDKTSDIFSAADPDDVDTQQSQEYSTTSPVFGKVSQKNKKPSLVCKPNLSLSNTTSPTFPRGTDNLTESSRPSLLLSESDPDDDVLIEQDHAETSPVFGRPSQNQRPSLACKPNLSGSPTFPRDPAVSKKYPNVPNTPTFSRSPRTPLISETNSEEDEVKVQGNTTSPVFGRTSQGHRPSLACKPNVSLSRSPTIPRGQTDSESVVSSKSPTFPTSPLFSDSERDSDWNSWKSRISLSPVVPAERGLLRPNIHSFSPNYKSLGPRHRTRRDVEGVSPGPSAPCASARLHPLPGRSDNQGPAAPPQNEPRPGPSQGLARRLPAHTLEAGGGVMVCYCWGVPFCPPGRDPDTYTEVIVDQLEFYEKSLKRAQRGLLRKARWSEPILPQPEKAPSPESSAESTIRRPARRRNLRLRPKRRAKSTSASSPERDEENEEEEEKNDDEQEDNVKDEKEDDNGDEVEDDNRDEQERNNNNDDELEDKKNDKQDRKKDEEEQKATAADGNDTDCEVCPETQLDPDDDDETQVLIMPTSAKAEPQSLSPSQSQSESQTVVPVQSQSTDQHRQTPEEMDVDAPADEEKEQEDMVVASPDGGQDERMEEETEEFKRTFLGRPGESHIKEKRTVEEEEEEEEEMMTTALQQGSSSCVPSSDPPGGPQCSPQRSQASSTMACPICQASFPLDRIEMHAATCNGEEEEEAGGGGGGHFASMAADHHLQVSLSPRPKRARNRGLTAEETAAHSSSVRNRGSTVEEASHSSSVGRLFDKKEKCYICHKAVPLSEFARHTEKCIRQETSRSEQRGDLLSALEQTESRDATEAGPSGVNYREVIDLSGHEEEEEEGEEDSEVLCVSDSPIRAFTSVSEASDCLVDFKKQLHPRSPSRRGAGRRGGRRRGGGGGGGASRGRAVKRKWKR